MFVTHRILVVLGRIIGIIEIGRDVPLAESTLLDGCNDHGHYRHHQPWNHYFAHFSPEKYTIYSITETNYRIRVQDLFIFFLSRGGSWMRIEIAAILASKIEPERVRKRERERRRKSPGTIPLVEIEKGARRGITERRLYIERYPARCLSQEDEGRTRGRNVTPRAATSYIYMYAWLTLRRRSRIYPIRETAHFLRFSRTAYFLPFRDIRKFHPPSPRINWQNSSSAIWNNESRRNARGREEENLIEDTM